MEILVDRGFGDSQSLKTSPGEHPQQPIEPSHLDRKIDDDDRARIAGEAHGLSLKSLAARLLDSISPDLIEAELIRRHGVADAASPEQVRAAEGDLKDQACQPLDSAELRNLIKVIKQKTDIVIDEFTVDEVTSSEFDLKQSQQRVTSFREFIEKNKNELVALQILYSQPFPKRRLTYISVQELATRLTDPPYHLTAADVWQAYKRLEASLVRGAPSEKVLTDIISLVRFATGQADTLEPYAARVEQKFNLWIGRQKKAGREFSEEQMNWLKAIKDYLAANVEISPADLVKDDPFSAWGGAIAARRLFGTQLIEMLNEITEVLAA